MVIVSFGHVKGRAPTCCAEEKHQLMRKSRFYCRSRSDGIMASRLV